MSYNLFNYLEFCFVICGLRWRKPLTCKWNSGMMIDLIFHPNCFLCEKPRAGATLSLAWCISANREDHCWYTERVSEAYNKAKRAQQGELRCTQELKLQGTKADAQLWTNSANLLMSGSLCSSVEVGHANPRWWSGTKCTLDVLGFIVLVQVWNKLVSTPTT